MPSVGRRTGIVARHYSKSYWIPNFSDVESAAPDREKYASCFRLWSSSWRRPSDSGKVQFLTRLSINLGLPHLQPQCTQHVRERWRHSVCVPRALPLDVGPLMTL